MSDYTDFKENIQKELKALEPRIEALGFELLSKQPHITGERTYQSQTRLVLEAIHTESGKKVIIKTSKDPEYKKELRYEKGVKELLERINYADKVLLSPRDLFYIEQDDYIFYISEYIEQDAVFVSHSLEEQFFMILPMLESMETYFISTYEMHKGVAKICPIYDYARYHSLTKEYKTTIEKLLPEKKALFNRALSYFKNHQKEIEMFTGYLIHDDLVPHNMRIQGRKIYMLDHATMRFGNKYDTWARFLNYMTIHNPELRDKLYEHIKQERDKEDYKAIQAMRVYKTFMILDYYVDVYASSKGNTQELALVRMHFWSDVLKSIIEETLTPYELIGEYRNKRDTLRSQEEKERQREFAVA